MVLDAACKGLSVVDARRSTMYRTYF